jgi:hypothetical protein
MSLLEQHGSLPSEGLMSRSSNQNCRCWAGSNIGLTHAAQVCNTRDRPQERCIKYRDMLWSQWVLKQAFLLCLPRQQETWRMEESASLKAFKSRCLSFYSKMQQPNLDLSTELKIDQLTFWKQHVFQLLKGTWDKWNHRWNRLWCWQSAAMFPQTLLKLRPYHVGF